MQAGQVSRFRSNHPTSDFYFMNSALSDWTKMLGLRRLVERWAHFLDHLVALLRIPPPDTPKLVQRISVMERDIVLPVKAACIAMLLYSFYGSPWIGIVSGNLEVAVESTQYF